MVKEKKTKVLIFILAYNAEKTICQTLDRIVPIEKYNLEVLVIDDASQDKTFTKVLAYKNNKKLQFKLTILKNLHNQGFGGNVKIGFTYAIKNSFDFKSFTKNSSINTTTMIIARSILNCHRFRKIQLLEDYLFKCKLLKSNNVAKKLPESLAYYRILDKSRSSRRLQNIYWLWYINKKYNKLNIFQNVISIFFISINSIRKYGIK